MIVNLLRGRRIDCGCRADSRPISWTLVAQDLLLAVACLWTLAQTPSGLVSGLLGLNTMTRTDVVLATCALADLWLCAQLIRVWRRTKSVLSAQPV